MVVREQRVQGSFAYTNPEFARAVELLASGQLEPAVTSSVVSLDESGDAFRALLERRADRVPQVDRRARSGTVTPWR